MTDLADRLQGRSPVPHHPWRRYEVDERAWVALAADCGRQPEPAGTLGRPALRAHGPARPGGRGRTVVSLVAMAVSHPSVPCMRPRSAWNAPSATCGASPAGAPDLRPWLARHDAALRVPDRRGRGCTRSRSGPIHAGIIEPGHFRFTCNGEAVVRLEQRLGWVHKGIEHLVQGMPVAQAARDRGRVSGDSTVAYAVAFARAVEAALGIEYRRARTSCGASWRSWSGWPITWAISARSATTPPSRSCWRIAPCCARRCCRRRRPASATA